MRHRLSGLRDFNCHASNCRWRIAVSTVIIAATQSLEVIVKGHRRRVRRHARPRTGTMKPGHKWDAPENASWKNNSSAMARARRQRTTSRANKARPPEQFRHSARLKSAAQAACMQNSVFCHFILTGQTIINYGFD